LGVSQDDEGEDIWSLIEDAPPLDQAAFQVHCFNNSPKKNARRLTRFFFVTGKKLVELEIVVRGPCRVKGAQFSARFSGRFGNRACEKGLSFPPFSSFDFNNLNAWFSN